MHLHILAIGRAKKSPEASLTDDYMKRLPKGAHIYEAESRLPYGPARKRDESQKLLSLFAAKGGKSSKLIALDPLGRDIASPELAQAIGKWRDAGIRDAFFAIGGADGHADELLERADMRLAFGKATWPHMLFRAMLAEQLYRAHSIIENHPYHKL